MITHTQQHPQSHRIRVEFHVAWLGHALPRVHLLDASPQVVPYLVQAYLFQSVWVLGPIWRHRGGAQCPLRSLPMPSLSCSSERVLLPLRLLSFAWFRSQLPRSFLRVWSPSGDDGGGLGKLSSVMWDGKGSHSARLGGAVCHSST